MTVRHALLFFTMVLSAGLALADPVPELTPEYGTDGDGISRHRLYEPFGFDSAYVGNASPDGRLLLGGISNALGGSGGTGRFAFLRLTPQGVLDPTFGVGGRGSFVLDIAAATEITAILTTGTGKIVFAGSNAQNSGIVAKVATDGGYDSNFGQNGRRYIGGSQFFDGAFAYFPRALVPLRSGGLLVVGIATTGQIACAGIALLTEAGNFDPALGSDGTLCLAPPREGDPLAIGTDAIELESGRILISGGAFRAGGAGFDMFVARMNPAGSLDPSFGADGSGFAFVSFDAGATLNDLAHAIDIDADGRIVIAGQVNVDATAHQYDMGIARLTRDGLPDPSFGSAGRLVLADAVSSTSSREARDVAVLADGRILVGGFVDANTDISMAVMLRASGSLDSGFGSAGVLAQGDAQSPAQSTLRAVPHTALMAGDFLYFLGSIQVGAYVPDIGFAHEVAVARYRLPLFRDGFE